MENEKKLSYGNSFNGIKKDNKDSLIDSRLLLFSHKDSKQKKEDKDFVGIIKGWARNKGQLQAESLRTRNSYLSASMQSKQAKVFLKKSPIFQTSVNKVPANIKGGFEDNINLMRVNQLREREEKIFGKAKNNQTISTPSLSCFAKPISTFKPLSNALPIFNPELKEQSSGIDKEIDFIRRRMEEKGISISVDSFAKAFNRPATSHYTGIPFAGTTLQSNPFVPEDKKKKRNK